MPRTANVGLAYLKELSIYVMLFQNDIKTYFLNWPEQLFTWSSIGFWQSLKLGIFESWITQWSECICQSQLTWHASLALQRCLNRHIYQTIYALHIPVAEHSKWLMLHVLCWFSVYRLKLCITIHSPKIINSMWHY